MLQQIFAVWCFVTFMVAAAPAGITTVTRTVASQIEEVSETVYQTVTASVEAQVTAEPFSADVSTVLADLWSSLNDEPSTIVAATTTGPATQVTTTVTVDGSLAVSSSSATPVDILPALIPLFDPDVPSATDSRDPRSEVTCDIDAGKVTLQHVTGSWYDDLEHQLVYLCSRHIDHYDVKTFKHDRNNATIKFTFNDLKMGPDCIENAIVTAGGPNVECRFPQQESGTNSGCKDNFKPAKVKINRWGGMSDKHNILDYGFWEIWGIENWRHPSSEDQCGRDMSHKEIYSALNQVMDSARNFVSIPTDPTHWRQFVDQKGRPAVYFGIKSSENAVRDAIYKVAKIEKATIAIQDRIHDGEWEEWIPRYAPFKFHKVLDGTEGDAIEGSEIQVELGKEGFLEGGRMHYPGKDWE